VSGIPLDHPLVARADARIERAAAAWRGNPTADRVLYALSEAGNHSVIWHAINATDALVVPRHRSRALRRSVLLGVEQAVVNVGIKSLFKRARPDPAVDHPYGLRTTRTSSFPSGHASAGACAATLLSRDLGAAPLWWGLAAAVAWSRVHVGAHHPSDIVAGAVTGRNLARIAGRIWP
jgi:membrane-associated phospholipid phosphatase